MNGSEWGKSDKKAAHAALDKAWAAEFAETKLKIIKQAADMRILREEIEFAEKWDKRRAEEYGKEDE